MHRIGFCVALVSMLAGCGFHLVDSQSLPEPLHHVYVDMAQGYRVSEPVVETALRAKLSRRGAQVFAKPEPSETAIHLSDLVERRETVSIGADGKALEYRIIITVRYSVQRAGVALMQPDEVSVSRDYSFKLDQILPKELEEQQLREHIQQEMAELLLLRMEARLRGQQLEAAPPQMQPATPAPAETPGG